MLASNEPNLLALAESVDPERFAHVRKELAVDAPAIAVLLGSVFAPLMPRHPWQMRAIEEIAHEGLSVSRRPREYATGLRKAIDDFRNADEVKQGLRRFAWQEKSRIALRELLPAALGGAGLTVTARELSDLADALLQMAVQHATASVAERWGAPIRSDGDPSELMVVGLGKLGGLELNGGSDVDIVFVYDTDDGGSQITLHEHWTYVVRRVTALMEEVTVDGSVWRVDLRLRPEGSRGPVANSLAASERYYETWGRMWERAALLRARCSVGGGALWESFSRDVVLPFVFRRNVEPSLAREMAEMAERARLELSRAPERDLKLGCGGIREAEFFVQSLQLIWGGIDESVRATGTLAGLSRLRSRGLVTDLEARTIADSYLLLRRVEHRIQWMTGLQTHTLPEGGEALARLVRSLGYESGDALAESLSAAREAVSVLFRGLSPEAPRPQGKYQLLLARIDAATDPRELAETFGREFGAGDVTEHLFALAHRPDGILGELTRARFPALGEAVLGAIAGASDPEQAARYLRAYFGRYQSAQPYIAAFGEDIWAVKRLVTAFGASSFVGEAIVNHPDLSQLVLFGALSAPDASSSVRAELALVPPRGTKDADDWREAFVGALRRAKRRVMVETAVADLAGMLDLRTVTRSLSDLADEILRLSVDFACEGNCSGLAVIAVGKLGGRDIGYGSDLDVIFIFDPAAAPDAESATEYFVRRAQAVIRLISTAHPEGGGYELDTRLRPSGSQGMLVTSLDSFARYHGVVLPGEATGAGRPSVSKSGRAWERQALVRARACAGDRELGERVEHIASLAAYGQGAPPAVELHQLRMRMQRELAKETKDRVDLKTGRGGLLDIEFAAQWLQMLHGANPAVRSTDTVKSLESLHAEGYLVKRDYVTLADGYAFLRRLEQRIHVLGGAGDSVLDRRQSGLPQLARRMGFQRRGNVPETDVMLSHYGQITEAVRAAYCRILRAC